MKIKSGFVLFLLLVNTAVYTQPVTQISVSLGKPLFEIQPVMWGVFFEDINFAADGGIYAELIKNRSFEFSHPLMGWRVTRQNGNGRLLPTFYSPSDPSNPRYLEIAADAPQGSFGITNEGFRGMGVKKGELYKFSVYASVKSASELVMTVELITPAGDILGRGEISGFEKEWKSYRTSFTSSATEPKAQLRIMIRGKGSIGVDMISLFPSDTWKGREGGLRKDIAQMIADLRPGFVRFPGGCIVEGRDLANRYQWKTTVGPVGNRKLIINRWNNEMRDRQAPDYFQSFGLGFYEYFLFAEDIGAEPLPILNCGMSCQYNSGEIVPLSDLDPYIEDALDLIEFANGSPETEWGRLRVSMGHPEPFRLKYIGVGNEQWDEQYIERYREFEKVLQKKHPEIKIVSGSGPSASGKMFDYAWAELKKLSPALVDEHYYMPPEWFLKNAARYDNYDRKGPKVFAGEYAAHWRSDSVSESRNTWYSALAEAAFMTGLERNADVVHMASYAPLLAHIDAWQWRPDLIWFDNLTTAPSANYYVQKMFSSHRGTNAVAVAISGQPVAGKDSLYASGTIDKTTGRAYIKIVNASRNARTISVITDVPVAGKEIRAEVLKSGDMMDYNSVKDPGKIRPSEKAIPASGRNLRVDMEGMSAYLLLIDTRKK